MDEDELQEKQYLLTNENIFDKIIKEESSVINKQHQEHRLPYAPLYKSK